MGLNLNFSGVEAAGTFPVFEGDFVFTIKEAVLEASKDGKTQNIRMQLRCSDGGDMDGKEMRVYQNVQESTMPFVKAFLNAVFNTELEGELDLDVSDLVGNLVGATVTNDGKYNSVEAWYPAA